MDKLNKSVKERTWKSLLWISIISMSMFFAGLTSYYIVYLGGDNFTAFNLTNEFFNLPKYFFASAVFLLLASLFLNKSFYSLKKNNLILSKRLSFCSFVLGVLFCYSQFLAFNEFIADGYNPLGSKSEPSWSIIYILAGVHLLHVVAGLILLLFNNYKFYMGRFSSKNILTLDLTRIYWNFIDILWIYILVFLIIVNK